MKELDEETGIGLIRKRRQGFGKSNMVYVKTFQVETQEDENTTVLEPEAETKQGAEKFEKVTGAFS